MQQTDHCERPRRRIILQSETDIEGWRNHARVMLQDNVAPNDLSWSVKNRAPTAELDFGDIANHEDFAKPLLAPSIRIEREFLKLIGTALLHRNEDRFHLAYRLLFPDKPTTSPDSEPSFGGGPLPEPAE